MDQKAKDAQARYRAKNRELLNQKSKEWRKNNPEIAHESAKKTREKYAEKISIANKLWHKNNPEKAKQLHQNYVALNSEKLKEYNRAYYLANKERLDKNSIEWKRQHPEHSRRAAHTRRVRKYKNGGKLSKGICAKLFALQKGKCVCCGKSLKNGYHLDHIVPLSLGGENSDYNVQLLTPKCNQLKHSKHPIDYMQSKGFLL